MRRTWVAILGALLTACGRQDAQNQVTANSPGPVPAAVTRPAPEPVANVAPAEPRKPIDPKSAEAAGQVVQHYGALVEQRRFVEAAKLWGDKTAAEAFARQLDHPRTHLEIGKLGAPEGAAGSIYMTVPVVFYGDSFRKPAEIILRRVNDVPGSTEAQRRWHIERIEWKAAP